MDRGAELNRSMVFVFGAPRSGTTWLQLLLSQHPAVATANETHLFSSYLGTAVQSWDALQSSERAIGLHHHMTEAEFLATIRQCADSMLDRVHVSDGANRPVFVEKTPAHVRCWDVLRRLYPESRFIHVVRDPRSMVASMRRAGRGWGARWAAPGVAANARRWVIDVDHGLRAESELGSQCRRVTYEALWQEGESTLRRCFEWLGLECATEDARRYVQACQVGRVRAGGATAAWDTTAEPAGFVGSGGIENWKNDLCRRDVRAVEWFCQDKMRELGYSPNDRGANRPMVARVDVILAWLEWKASDWRGRL